jgi:hypothetical protein
VFTSSASAWEALLLGSKSPVESGPMTIGEFLKYLHPTCLRSNKSLFWPPDIFALCMSLLHKSGCYTAILKSWPPSGSHDWESEIAAIGTRWRETGIAKDPPEQIGNWWKIVKNHRDIEIGNTGDSPKLIDALLQLVAAADESCAGVGIPGGGREDDDFGLFAGLLLHNSEPSSLCRIVDSSKCRVIPKMHSPQNGLTVRSLTHHLGFVSGDEMKPRWRFVPFDIKRDEISILLIPWPEFVDPADFRPSNSAPNMRNMRADVGMFSYAPTHDQIDARAVEKLITGIRKRKLNVDGIILPELSMDLLAARNLRTKAVKRGAFFVAGVRDMVKQGINRNSVLVSFPFDDTYVEYLQFKHHRWKLDRSQITSYGMSALSMKPIWWEDVDVTNRTLNLFAMKPWLTMAVLICEDLARPDPVGDLIRAVGPNLVIALLMDGPQVEPRWPGRHATVLADDPGCSVLTLSCLGMTRLGNDVSKDPAGMNKVALWRDPMTRGATSIELTPEASAILLNIGLEEREEFTADGRSDSGATGYPTLLSYTPITRDGIPLDPIVIKPVS